MGKSIRQNNFKIASCTVLYNPTDKMIENIFTYYSLVDVCYFFDNSTHKNQYFINELNKLEKIKYIDLKDNLGIAHALREGCSLAIKEEIDYLLTMDQDSQYPTDDFKIILNFLQNYNMNTVGQISISSNNNPITGSKDFYEEAKLTITSGSLINIANYKNIDGFLADLFIDIVDFHLNYQFYKKGFKIIYFPNIQLVHNLGNPKIRKIFWKKFISSNHESLRYYYMYRNITFCQILSEKEGNNFFYDKYKSMNKKLILKILLFERERFKKIKYALRGLKDGKKLKLGKYIE